MMVETAVYAAAALVLVGGVGIVAVLVRADDVPTAAGGFRWLYVIPAVAALAYVAMALGVGTVTAAGHEVLVPRYLDWLLTTPVLVGYVGYVAGASRRAIAGVALADAAMIAVGFVAAVTVAPIKYVAFVVSAGFHLALLGVLYRAFPSAAADRSVERRRLFGILKHHVGLLWIAYPVVWLASPAGIGVVGTTALAIVIPYLDVAAKVPYVYFVYAHRRAFVERAPARRTGQSGEADPGTPAPAD